MYLPPRLKVIFSIDNIFLKQELIECINDFISDFCKKNKLKLIYKSNMLYEYDIDIIENIFNKDYLKPLSLKFKNISIDFNYEDFEYEVDCWGFNIKNGIISNDFQIFIEEKINNAEEY